MIAPGPELLSIILKFLAEEPAEHGHAWECSANAGLQGPFLRQFKCKSCGDTLVCGGYHCDVEYSTNKEFGHSLTYAGDLKKCSGNTEALKIAGIPVSVGLYKDMAIMIQKEIDKSILEDLMAEAKKTGKAT